MLALGLLAYKSTAIGRLDKGKLSSNKFIAMKAICIRWWPYCGCKGAKERLFIAMFKINGSTMREKC